VRAGAKLDADKSKLKLNAELAELQQGFHKTQGKMLTPSWSRSASNWTALDRTGSRIGRIKGKRRRKASLFCSFRTRLISRLMNLKNRALREKIMKVSLARNSRGGEWDNWKVVL
jgi:hypothetical protein